MARLEAPLSAFGCVPVWMIDDGAATNFFGRKNSYSLVRFVLAGPGRRWDTAARKPNHSMEWLAVPLFSNTLFFFARGSPLGSAIIKFCKIKGITPKMLARRAIPFPFWGVF